MNDYAANTDGLPKTDFEALKNLGHNIVDTVLLSERLLESDGGKKVGHYVVDMLQAMERQLASLNFNAFAKTTMLDITFERNVMLLCAIYLVRLKLRERDMPVEPKYLSEEYLAMWPLTEECKAVISSLSELAKQKDAEYGASWCKRGGIGAWFTTVRKFDRMITQIAKKDGNVWDVSEPINSTESLEETIKDAINYLLLILEKRDVIYKSREPT